MNITITLCIRLDNDAMLSSSDVAGALENVAERFRESGYIETIKEYSSEQISRGILDGNGQNVGEFTIKNK